MQLHNHTVLGIYSDSAALSVEIAVIETDGLDISKVHQTHTSPYPYELREALLAHLANKQENVALFNSLGRQITEFFIKETKQVLQEMESLNVHVDLICLCGHPAQHNPEQKVHLTFGNAQELANALGKPVVHHFVKEDLNAGGVGSPLLATFWATLCQKIEKPVAVVGLGGVTHIVYIGPVGELMGFDIGAGLALVDNWVFRRTGQEVDFNGLLAAKGKTDERVLKALLKFPYLQKIPPKSVKKTDFIPMMAQVEGLSVEDGAATLTSLTSRSIIEAQRFLPSKPVQWIFIGGGTYNATLMLQLAQALPNVVSAKEILPYKDALNAMGFAFIGTRYLMGLPISFPTTTGVQEPFSGGELTEPEKNA